MRYSSLPTTEQANIDKLYDVIRKLDPELYLIKVALQEYKLNPSIIIPIIKSIGNLAYSTGYGKVQIFMQAKIITQIKPEESLNIEQEALIDIDKEE